MILLKIGPSIFSLFIDLNNVILFGFNSVISFTVFNMNLFKLILSLSVFFFVDLSDILYFIFCIVFKKFLYSINFLFLEKGKNL